MRSCAWGFRAANAVRNSGFAAVYVLCRLLGIPTLETEVTTLMAALPVGINVYMMAADFKAEEGATSSSILLSTMLSAVTVPLLLAFFGVEP